jgi:hypothetical protein
MCSALNGYLPQALANKVITTSIIISHRCTMPQLKPIQTSRRTSARIRPVLPHPMPLLLEKHAPTCTALFPLALRVWAASDPLLWRFPQVGANIAACKTPIVLPHASDQRFHTPCLSYSRSMHQSALLSFLWHSGCGQQVILCFGVL